MTQKKRPDRDNDQNGMGNDDDQGGGYGGFEQ